MKTVYWGKSKGFKRIYPMHGNNDAECPKCYSKFRKELLPFHMAKCVG